MANGLSFKPRPLPVPFFEVLGTNVICELIEKKLQHSHLPRLRNFGNVYNLLRDEYFIVILLEIYYNPGVQVSLCVKLALVSNLFVILPTYFPTKPTLFFDFMNLSIILTHNSFYNSIFDVGFHFTLQQN